MTLLRLPILVFAVLLTLLAPVAASAQQENQPEACSGVQTDCQMISFVKFGEDESINAVIIQRVSDPLINENIMSDYAINSYFEGIGPENILSVQEATHNPQLAMDYLDTYSYRVFVGETVLLGEPQSFVIVFVTDGFTTHIIMAVGAYPGFNAYVEEAITGGDWTVTPEGYFPL